MVKRGINKIFNSQWKYLLHKTMNRSLNNPIGYPSGKNQMKYGREGKLYLY